MARYGRSFTCGRCFATTRILVGHNVPVESIMNDPDTVKQLYAQTVVIDALNVSNWESPAVLQSLRDGGLTAVNVTLAT